MYYCRIFYNNKILEATQGRISVGLDKLVHSHNGILHCYKNE